MSAREDVQLPTTKLSATILEFGEPLLSKLEEPTPDALRSALTIVIAVWNAHVMAMPVWGKPEHLANLESLRVPPLPNGENPVVELGVRRKQRFASDPRFVGEWAVEADGHGGFQFRCDTRVPQELVPRS